ncbi:response regulator transcription factor [Gracilimonas sp.]|uniref:LuxR C-terminal-related transcriptional regulator n=1 Tax=Gracilimonas sp. TaxID=1974203 RepID=UPI0025C29A15|nr:response regulator transcription factor [Gracilimonas sp.]
MSFLRVGRGKTISTWGGKMTNIDTIVADGNEIFRYGLSSILRDHGAFNICSEVDNGALVLTAFESVKPQLCILSFSMPEMEGIIIAKKIIEKNSDANILLLAEDTDQKTLDEFLDSGAFGLIHKSAHHLELIDAAQKVAKGERFLGKQFSKMMTKEYIRLARKKKRPDPIKSVTKREREILGLLTEGLTSTEIASKLYISPRTVEKHRTNLLKKLDLKNTAALVRFAMENEQALL